MATSSISVMASPIPGPSVFIVITQATCLTYFLSKLWPDTTISLTTRRSPLSGDSSSITLSISLIIAWLYSSTLAWGSHSLFTFPFFSNCSIFSRLLPFKILIMSWPLTMPIFVHTLKFTPCYWAWLTKLTQVYTSLWPDIFHSHEYCPQPVTAITLRQCHFSQTLLSHTQISFLSTIGLSPDMSFTSSFDETTLLSLCCILLTRPLAWLTFKYQVLTDSCQHSISRQFLIHTTSLSLQTPQDYSTAIIFHFNVTVQKLPESESLSSGNSTSKPTSISLGVAY